MKFINLKTGVILEPHNEMVIEQMKKSPDYQLFEEETEQLTTVTVSEPTEEVKPVKRKKK